MYSFTGEALQQPGVPSANHVEGGAHPHPPTGLLVQLEHGFLDDGVLTEMKERSQFGEAEFGFTAQPDCRRHGLPFVVVHKGTDRSGLKVFAHDAGDQDAREPDVIRESAGLKGLGSRRARCAPKPGIRR